MIDLTTINEWQRLDSDGLVMPWLTFPALDEILTWDLKDKTVLEIGGGASTVWWNRRAKSVLTIEENYEWREHIFNTWNEVFQNDYNPCFIRDESIFEEIEFKANIAIVDNEGERDKWILIALQYLKPYGILIVDNWMQPSVDWVPSREIQDLLLSCNHKIFKQPGHIDWQTLFVYL